MTHLLVNNAAHDGPDPEVVKVPSRVAVCPECGGGLFLQVNEWETDTGAPTDGGIDLDCERAPDFDDPDYDDKCHRNWQGEWQPVYDRVTAWARRHVRVVKGDGT